MIGNIDGIADLLMAVNKLGDHNLENAMVKRKSMWVVGMMMMMVMQNEQ